MPEQPAHSAAPSQDALLQADAIAAKIRAQVVEYGWAAVAVDSSPPFTYTVGLWRLADHPELIITGLPAETAKWVLDQAVNRIRAGGEFRPGSTIDGLMGVYPAVALEVASSRLPDLAFAADLYRGLIFKALQLVWPDRQGKFPWDRRSESEYRTAQPLLGSAPRLRRLARG